MLVGRYIYIIIYNKKIIYLYVYNKGITFLHIFFFYFQVFKHTIQIHSITCMQELSYTCILYTIYFMKKETG